MDREDQNASLLSPLVHITVEDTLKVDNIQQNKDKAIERTEVYEEVRKQLWLAGPLISVSILNYSLQIISVMFVGHLGELPLSGASMATSFASVTGFSLLVGMASALDTLCGQSYGAKQHHMLGIHMQRAMIVLMIVSIHLAFIWANARSILIALGQDPEISAEAGQYALLMIPSLFAYGILQCLNRFLQTQNIVFPMVLSSGVTTLLHILICWTMVFKSGLGNRGAAIANAISYWINVLILILYVKFSPSCSKTWTGFSKEALHGIPSFLRLAIPSAVMVCLEMWSFEMMVLLSGLLPNPKLETSVLSICLNTSTTVWMISFGLSGAVSTRVSNELGAGHPRAARLAVYFVFIMAIIEGTFVGAVMILIRNIWGYAYSNQAEVVQYVAIMLPILATSIFLDALQCVLSGTARGCGWQKIGAFINLGSYYLVGIPSAILFAFVFQIGGKGLWMGIICALVVQVSCLMIITIRTDWEQEAKKVKDRVYYSMRAEMGLCTVLDTFCGQSNGAGQYHMLGIHMQRSMIVVLTMSVFLSIIWANTEPILKAMHQDKAISKEAGSYARYMIPSLFAYGLLQCTLKFLQTQKIVFPMVLSSGIAAGLHVLLCWLLVFKLRLGSRGAALALSISYWVNAILISLYVRFSSSCKQSWTGFSRLAFHNLLQFLKLAVPSAIMHCLKVWTFELMVLMSGLLSNPALETSVLSICLNTFGLAWMIPFGFSAAVSVRVSNELGGGNPEAANVAVKVVLSIALIEGIILVTVMILLRNVWGNVYSNDKQVIRYVSSMMPILAISSFLDGIQSALSGILAGCGWQKIGAYVNLGSFYLVGVPCAVVLAFVVHMKAKGLWLGIISAFVVQVLFYLVITFRTNWEEQARKAQNRVEHSNISPMPTTRDSVLHHAKPELVP